MTSLLAHSPHPPTGPHPLTNPACSKPRILDWIEPRIMLGGSGPSRKRLCKPNPAPEDGWKTTLEGLLESKSMSPAAAAAGLEPRLPLSDAMTEVFDIVAQFAGGPVRDGSAIIAGGIVATEFVVAAMLVHGVNLAAEVLGRASSGQINSWSILEIIGVNPADLLVTRRATDTIAAAVLPAGTATARPGNSNGVFPECGRLPPLDGAFPKSPTRGSNWILPGHLIIGSHPNDDDARAIIGAGVTTFVSLIGEYSTEHYHSRKYPGASSKPTTFIHFPIQDFHVPAPAALEALVLDLKRRLVEREVVYVHCRGGHGRTGTVVIPLVAALCDVELGPAAEHVNLATIVFRPDDADDKEKYGWVAELPETEEQEQAMKNATRTLKSRGKRR